MRLRYKPWALSEMRQDDKFFENPWELKGKWKEVFGNDRPIDLEIGCGKGDFVTKKAKRDADRNIIAIDLKNEVLVYALRKINEAELTNVRLISMKAEEIEKLFDKDEIDDIYINFANPWPKASHNKRRLTHPRFLNKYRDFQKDGSLLIFKTDAEELYIDSQEYFNESGYEILFKTDDLDPDHPSNIETEYESKFRSFGMPIYHILARKKQNDGKIIL